MPVFSYSALKTDGSMTRGELSASDRSAAIRMLGRKGLQPVNIETKLDKAPAAEPKKAGKPDGAAARREAKPPGGGERGGARSEPEAGSKEAARERQALAGKIPKGGVRLKRSQVVLFTEELSDLLAAGLQLEPALRIMESRDELSNLKLVAAAIRQQVRDGASFSSALRAASPSFGELYCSLAAAGEVSGALPTILRRQAVYLVKLQDLQNKVVLALIYPTCLLVAVLAVSFLFVSFLMPELTSMLRDMGRDLPTPAKVMMSLSGFLRSYWYLIILGIVVAFVGFRRITSTPPYEERWHKSKFGLPLVGPVLQRRFFVQFLETLGNLVSNGLPLLKGLELTRNATLNLHARGLLNRIIDMVGEGASLSKTMRRVGFFPPLLTDMVAVGEQTGDLSTALNRAAERYDKELEKGIQRITALMQPVILFILASIVGPMAYIMIKVVFESVSSIR